MPSPLAAMLASAIGGPQKIQGALPSRGAPPPIAQAKAPPPKPKLPGKDMKSAKSKPPGKHFVAMADKDGDGQ